MEEEKGYITLLKKKEFQKKALREAALKEAERLSTLLKEKFEYEALYLIGSVFKGKAFRPHSDIDFVIKGFEEGFIL